MRRPGVAFVLSVRPPCNIVYAVSAPRVTTRLHCSLFYERSTEFSILSSAGSAWPVPWIRCDLNRQWPVSCRYREGPNLRNGGWQFNPPKCFLKFCLFYVPSTRYPAHRKVFTICRQYNQCTAGRAGREPPTPAMTPVVKARLTWAFSQMLRAKTRKALTCYSVGHTEERPTRSFQL